MDSRKASRSLQLFKDEAAVPDTPIASSRRPKATYVPHTSTQTSDVAVESDSEEEHPDPPQEGAYPLSVELTPYRHKVGGHTAIFQFSRQAVCKALVSREDVFYETIEKNHPELLAFMPKYIGVLNVRHDSRGTRRLSAQDDSVDCGSAGRSVLLDDNIHILPPHMVPRSRRSSEIRSPQSFSLETNYLRQGATTVNNQLKEQVLKEVFAGYGGLGGQGSANQGQLHGSGLHHSASNQSIHTSAPIFELDEEAGVHAEGTHSAPVSPVLCPAVTERFILIEDLTLNRHSPCVLDLKMGTRQYGVDATAKKRASQQRKCLSTTSLRLGTRVCGVKVIHPDTGTKFFRDKYYGRRLHEGPEFRGCLGQFLYDGVSAWSILRHIPKLIKRLDALHAIVSALIDYRLYGASLLIVYDANVRDKTDISIRLIDFARCVTAEHPPTNAAAPPEHKNTPDNGFLRGVRTLTRTFKRIYKTITGHEYSLEHFDSLNRDDFAFGWQDSEDVLDEIEDGVVSA